MAKKKVSKKVDKGIGIEFHSWTFFIFLIFVLVTVLILAAQQMGMRIF
jgi:hypothetical protein